MITFDLYPVLLCLGEKEMLAFAITLYTWFLQFLLGLLTTAICLTGSPIEERQPFPNLNPLRPALPIISPTSTPIGTAAHRRPQQPGRVPVPVTESLREPQEQAEPVHHAASNASASTTDHSTGSTRIPRPPGAVDTFSRFEQN